MGGNCVPFRSRFASPPFLLPPDQRPTADTVTEPQNGPQSENQPETLTSAPPEAAPAPTPVEAHAPEMTEAAPDAPAPAAAEAPAEPAEAATSVAEEPAEAAASVVAEPIKPVFVPSDALSNISFSSLNLPEELARGIADAGFERCTPIQAGTLPLALAGIDVAGQAAEVVTKGRHDPCVGIRATPIAEAMLALVVMDHVLRHRAQCGDVRSALAPIAAQAPTD